NPGIASRSARCSSLYQRLNSASFSAGTSAHTIRSPVPFFAVVDSLMHGPFPGRIVDQGAAECQRKAAARAAPFALPAFGVVSWCVSDFPLLTGLLVRIACLGEVDEQCTPSGV